MNKKQIERTVNNIKLAIELAGDGGVSPYSTEEIEEMNNFLEKSVEKFNI